MHMLCIYVRIYAKMPDLYWIDRYLDWIKHFCFAAPSTFRSLPTPDPEHNTESTLLAAATV